MKEFIKVWISFVSCVQWTWFKLRWKDHHLAVLTHFQPYPYDISSFLQIGILRWSTMTLLTVYTKPKFKVDVSTLHFQNFQLGPVCIRISLSKCVRIFFVVEMHCLGPKDDPTYLWKVHTTPRSWENQQRSHFVENPKSFFVTSLFWQVKILYPDDEDFWSLVHDFFVNLLIIYVSYEIFNDTKNDTQVWGYGQRWMKTSTTHRWWANWQKNHVPNFKNLRRQDTKFWHVKKVK